MNTLEISTSNAKTENNNRLHYRFKNTMHLDGYISLSHVVLWYNWRNITTAIGNNRLEYKYGGNTREIIFPDGSYSVKDINNFIHSQMESFTDVDTTKAKTDPERYGISLYENATYNRVSLVVGATYILYLGAGLAKTLGGATTPYNDISVNFPNVPQIEPVKNVQIHCSLVNNKYQQDNSLLYNFTPQSAYGSLLSVEPRFPQWRQTRDTEVTEIHVWLTNQSGKVLMLEDDWGVTMQIADPSLIKL